MFVSLTLTGLAILCLVPAILDAFEDRRFRRDFSREQQSETQAALDLARLAEEMQVQGTEETKGLFTFRG